MCFADPKLQNKRNLSHFIKKNYILIFWAYSIILLDTS